MLGVTIDNKLSFEPHLNLVCKKVSQKLQALAGVSKFISKKNVRVIMRALSCCSSVTVFCYGCVTAKALNNKINKLHERASRILNFNDRQSTFEELIDKSAISYYPPQKLTSTCFKIV